MTFQVYSLAKPLSAFTIGKFDIYAPSLIASWYDINDFCLYFFYAFLHNTSQFIISFGSFYDDGSVWTRLFTVQATKEDRANLCRVFPKRHII